MKLGALDDRIASFFLTDSYHKWLFKHPQWAKFVTLSLDKFEKNFRNHTRTKQSVNVFSELPWKSVKKVLQFLKFLLVSRMAVQKLIFWYGLLSS